MPSAAKSQSGPERAATAGSGQAQSSRSSEESKTSGGTASRPRTSSVRNDTNEIKMTIPTDRILSTAAGMVMTPLAVARQVLPAKGGLPLYAGLGALAAVGIVEWPVAAAAGAGYALARFWDRKES